MTVECCGQEAGETMEEDESKWVTGDGLDEEHTVEIEKEETVKLDFAPTPEANPNDSDMVEGYGVRFVKGDGLEEDTGVEHPVKPSNSDTVWINSGYEAILMIPIL